MANVMRYEPDMREDRNGDFIEYYDYEELEKENDRLEEENKELRRVINDLKENER